MPKTLIENHTSLEEENKKKKKRFIWFWLILIILAAIAGGTFFYYHRAEHTSKSQVVSGDFLPKKKDARDMTDAELGEYAQKAVDDSKFQLEINSSSIINYDTQSGYIGIKNPKTNAYPINVTFFTQNRKKIYSSGAIEPGQEVTNGKLTEKIQRGKYEIRARFDIYDNKTHEKRGQQFAIVNMIVQ